MKNDYIFDLVITEDSKYMIFMDEVFVNKSQFSLGSIWDNTYIFNEILNNKLSKTLNEDIKKELNIDIKRLSWDKNKIKKWVNEPSFLNEAENEEGFFKKALNKVGDLAGDALKALFMKGIVPALRWYRKNSQTLLGVAADAFFSLFPLTAPFHKGVWLAIVALDIYEMIVDDYDEVSKDMPLLNLLGDITTLVLSSAAGKAVKLAKGGIKAIPKNIIKDIAKNIGTVLDNVVAFVKAMGKSVTTPSLKDFINTIIGGIGKIKGIMTKELGIDIAKGVALDTGIAAGVNLALTGSITGKTGNVAGDAANTVNTSNNIDIEQFLTDIGKKIGYVGNVFLNEETLNEGLISNILNSVGNSKSLGKVGNAIKDSAYFVSRLISQKTIPSDLRELMINLIKDGKLVINPNNFEESYFTGILSHPNGTISNTRLRFKYIMSVSGKLENLTPQDKATFEKIIIKINNVDYSFYDILEKFEKHWSLLNAIKHMNFETIISYFRHGMDSQRGAGYMFKIGRKLYQSKFAKDKIIRIAAQRFIRDAPKGTIWNFIKYIFSGIGNTQSVGKSFNDDGFLAGVLNLTGQVYSKFRKMFAIYLVVSLFIIFLRRQTSDKEYGAVEGAYALISDTIVMAWTNLKFDHHVPIRPIIGYIWDYAFKNKSILNDSINTLENLKYSLEEEIGNTIYYINKNKSSSSSSSNTNSTTNTNSTDSTVNNNSSSREFIRSKFK